MCGDEKRRREREANEGREINRSESREVKGSNEIEKEAKEERK